MKRWEIFRTFYTTALLTLLALAVTGPALPAYGDVRAKVINGNRATPGAWPFMVALIAKGATSSAEGQFCGGSLIGPQHILTAAHCVAGADPRDIVVQVGGGDLSFDPLTAQDVLGIKVHPNFDYWSLTNDLAILKLKNPVLTPPIAVALSSDAALYTGDTPATVIGYGKIDPTLWILPLALQQAVIPLASDQTCQDEIGRLFNPATQLCAGTKASSASAADGVGVCNGDSGGPLIVSDGGGTFKQVGVVSWGLGACANHRTRGVFSKILAHGSFVTSFPEAPPIAESLPTLSAPSELAVGSPLNCTPPTFYGDTPSQIIYRWYIGEAQLISGASSSTYTVTDQDTAIRCSVEAINSGGSSGERFSGPIKIAVAETPTPTPIPDTTNPRGSIRALGCSGRTCSFVAIATDDTSGVASVKMRVNISSIIRTSTRAKGTRVKRVTIKRIVNAHSVFNTVWEGQFRLARNSRQRINAILMVRDSAGNNNPTADTRQIQTGAR